MQGDQQVGGRILRVVGVDADDVDASDRGEKALPARRGVPVAVVGAASAGETMRTRGSATGTPSCCALPDWSRARPGGLTPLIDR
jgi:hypothetical protein